MKLFELFNKANTRPQHRRAVKALKECAVFLRTLKEGGDLNSLEDVKHKLKTLQDLLTQGGLDRETKSEVQRMYGQLKTKYKELTSPAQKPQQKPERNIYKDVPTHNIQDLKI